jgi:hypothetical protein
MCQRTKCSKCSKPTFVGCGLHVEQVLGDVPPLQRCRCREQNAPSLEDPSSSGPTSPPRRKWRLWGRRRFLSADDGRLWADARDLETCVTQTLDKRSFAQSGSRDLVHPIDEHLAWLRALRRERRSDLARKIVNHEAIG